MMIGKRKRICILLTGSLLLSCATTATKWIVAPPETGMSLLVGGILVENDGVDELYQAHKANITVVIVGRFIRNGQELIKGYRVKTDRNGFFAISNVPQGAYVLKGIEVDVGFARRMLIGSCWEGNSQIYKPVSDMISYTVRVWPEPIRMRIINMNIRYFKIDQTGHILHSEFRSLNNMSVGLKEFSHTMQSPVGYIRNELNAEFWFSE